MNFKKLLTAIISSSCCLAAIPIAAGATNTVTDTFKDWTLTSAHTWGVALDSSNPMQFPGDLSRVKRVSDTPQSVTYHRTGISTFTATLFWTGAIANRVSAMASSDGARWTAVKTTITGNKATANGWSTAGLRPAGRLPAHTNFVKFNIANDKLIYTPQIGQVKLTCSN